MAKLTSDLQDLRKKDIKALQSLVLEIRENIQNSVLLDCVLRV